MLALGLTAPTAYGQPAEGTPEEPDTDADSADVYDDAEQPEEDASSTGSAEPGTAGEAGKGKSSSAEPGSKGAAGKGKSGSDEPGREATAAAKTEEKVKPQAQKLELTFGGMIQSDVRFRLSEQSVGLFYDQAMLPAGVARNENLLKLKLNAGFGPITGVADADLVFYGHAQDVAGLAGLSRREKVDAFRFDLHSLYIQAEDLFVPGLDLRVGQQLLSWGVGSGFNPTDNLNADDVEDPLRFGDQQGNAMLRLDYSPDKRFSHTVAVVPLFRPALLPPSMELRWSRLERIDLVDPSLRHRLFSEYALAASPVMNSPYRITSIDVELPEVAVENMQFAYAFSADIMGHQAGLSIYRGRTDFPQPLSLHTSYNPEPVCHPDEPSTCVAATMDTELTLHYPKMTVFGLNAKGEIPLQELAGEAFSPIGYHLELAVIQPDMATLTVSRDALPGIFPSPGGEYDYDRNGFAGGPKPIVVDSEPFAKWVLGFSYKIREMLKAEIQWIHGLPEEYGRGSFFKEGYTVVGAGATCPTCSAVQCVLEGNGDKCAHEFMRPRIGDYLSAAVEYRLLDQAMLLRLFALFDTYGVLEERFYPDHGQRIARRHYMFSEEGFSALLYPEIRYDVGWGLELGAGALIKIGGYRSKFGDPAEGGSQLFSRASLTF